SDMELAASLLGDAVAARPNDVALRELHERLASHAGVERGKWREAVAAELGAEAEQRLLIEAALEYERAGDLASAARVARRAAEHHGGPFIRLTSERLDIALGNTTARPANTTKPTTWRRRRGSQAEPPSTTEDLSFG